MRDINVIKAEISKLEAELADAVSHDKMRTAAVHIVRNLGWEWDSKLNQWRSPKKERDFKVFDQNTSTHIKAGDWVYVSANFASGHRSGYAYVRSVRGSFVTVSFVRGVTKAGANVEYARSTALASECKVVSHTQVLDSYY